ncbi:hypothetical protein R6Q59_024431 [Mikania micrantha]
MGKGKTIESFLKKQVIAEESDKARQEKQKRQRCSTSEPDHPVNEVNLNHGIPIGNEVVDNNLERDPAKRMQMFDRPVNLREQVRRAYLNLGPYQIYLKDQKQRSVIV